MLRIANLQLAYDSSEVLRNITMEVAPGSCIALLGRNGAGKTSTLRAIMGLQASTSDTLEFRGEKLQALPARRRPALGIGYMPEDRKLMPHWSVQQNILLPALASPGLQSRFEETLEIIPELKPWLTRTGNELSGGQQKLVALARAFMVGSQLLLLDEPFEGVAPALAQRVLMILKTILDQGRQAMLLTESDRSLSEEFRTGAYLIERGFSKRVDH